MPSCSSICTYIANTLSSLYHPWYIIAAVLIAFVLYYYFFKRNKLKLYCQSTERNDFICQNVAAFQRVYRPTFYLFAGVLQTVILELFKVLAKKDCGITYERELVKLEDGGQLSLDWPETPPSFELKKNTPLLVILSGMTGGRKDVYVAKLIKDAFVRNCRPILLNQRGLSHTPLTSPKLYCGDMTDDVHRAMLAIKAKYPENPLYAVGLSLGANIITNVRANDDK